MRVEFHSPETGDVIRDPDIAWLEDRILKGGPAYWAPAGQTGITFFSAAGDSAVLTITFRGPDGFSLSHAGHDHVVHVSLARADERSLVTVYVGGEPIVVPRAWFVPPYAAWEAVRRFCEDGGRSDRIQWARKEDERWREEDCD